VEGRQVQLGDGIEQKEDEVGFGKNARGETGF